MTLILAGCAGGNGAGELTTQGLTPDSASAASQAVPAGKARLALSRPSGLLYAGAAATVKVNGTKVADLYPGSSQTVDITPGNASITVDAWSYPGSWTDELNVAAGATYQIEVAAREDGVGTAVLFGAIGGAIEAQNNPKSGLFQWKVLSQSAPQVAAAPQPPQPATKPPSSRGAKQSATRTPAGPSAP